MPGPESRSMGSAVGTTQPIGGTLDGPPTPPKGYTLNPPKPPTGYSLDSVPAFIRQGIDTSKVAQTVDPVSQQGAPDVKGTDTISEATPGKIAISHPDQFTQHTENHEMTHEYQDTRGDGSVPLGHGYALAPFGTSESHAPEQYAAGDPRNYQYGNEKALIQAQKSGKTIAHFNIEQQADMVADYKSKQDAYLAKAKAGKLTDKDKKQMYQTYQAYHPFVQQLASVPTAKQETLDSVKTLLGFGPKTLAPAPTPGLPAYDTPGLGVAPADPLLGGQSIATGTPSQKTTIAEPKKASKDTLQQVLKEYPGLAKNFNTGDTSVVFASGDRAKRGLTERGGLEFWFPDDKGDPDFPSPAPGKSVLEVYSDDLKKDPTALKQAVYGDLMHGMVKDPQWNSLRSQFMQNFTPQELKRQEQHKTWWEDVNGSKDRNDPTYDAYIRGWLLDSKDENGRQGQVESKNTMYSQKQIQILRQMEDYLKTGSNPRRTP